MPVFPKPSSIDDSRRIVLKGAAFGLLTALFSPLLSIPAANAASPGPQSKKTLIVYYSWSGNTRQIVGQIQKTIQADVVELKPVDPYPAEYKPTTVRAKKEQEANYRPPLSTTIDNLDDYDTVIIGSPNWWGTVAMPVFTFLETYDLSGKNVAVYITHEGSRLGRAVDDVKRLSPNANVLEGLAIRGSGVGSAQKDVNAWLQKTGLAR